MKTNSFARPTTHASLPIVAAFILSLGFLTGTLRAETFQPDNTIGVKKLKGDDIYNRSGKGQRIPKLTVNVGKTVNFKFSVQNDGDVVDTIIVSATEGTRLFKIDYFEIVVKEVKVDGKIKKQKKYKRITKKITGRGGIMLQNMEPGETRRFLATVTRLDMSPTVALEKKIKIRSQSYSLASKVDVVRARVKVSRR